MKRTHSLSGFTIVELLIVVVIIAILAAITIVSYNGITNRATQSALQEDLAQNAKTIASYQILNNTYPADQSAATLKANGSDVLVYNPNQALTAFCLQGSNKNFKYFVTEANLTPQQGVCSGSTGTVGVTAVTPTVLGSLYTTNEPGAVNPSATIDITSIPNGSWMIASFLASGTYTSYTTDPQSAGWSRLYGAPFISLGTRTVTVWAKIKTASDTALNIAIDSSPASRTYAAGLIYGTGSSTLTGWVNGTAWNRGGTGAYTNTNPSINLANNSLAVALDFEATLAAETATPPTMSPSGWSLQQFIGQGVSNRIETILYASKPYDSGGATDTLTVTYQNSQASNGTGIQIGIPNN